MKKILKLLVIIFIGVILKVIQLPILEDPISKVLHLRMIKNSSTTPFVSIILILAYLSFAVIFVKFEGRLNGNKMYKGFVYGLLFGLLWLFGMIENGIVYQVSIVDEIVYGIGDAIPLIVMGILLGIFLGTHSSHKVRSILFKKDVISTAIITLIYVLGRYFSYIVIGAKSAYSTRPVETLLWTLGTGLLISMMYYFMKAALQHYSLVKRVIIFSFILFGIDWFLYNLFIPLIYDISLSQIVSSYFGRSLLDMIYICIGIYASEKIAK